MSTERALTPEEGAALEKLYKEQYRNFFNTAISLLGSEQLAYDVIQDTFAEGAKKIDQVMSSPKPGGWLYITMCHLIMHILRMRSRLLTKNIPLEDIPELVTGEEGIEINELNMENKDMQLLARYYLYGYSINEIADELGISVQAARMRIKRAKERLKKDPNIKNLNSFDF